MASPRRARPDDPVRDRANGMNADGTRAGGRTNGGTADPMATQGGQSHVENVSRADTTRGDVPANGYGSAPNAPGGGYATSGYGAQPQATGREASVQQSAISAPNALLLIAGLWLIISRFVFDFPATGSTAGGVLNGVVIGIAVAVMALVRMSAYRSNPMINLVTVVAGAWMMASPWAFSYAHWGTGGRPAWSDIIVGGAIILLGLAGAAGNAMRRSGSGSRMTMGRGGGRLATR